MIITDKNKLYIKCTNVSLFGAQDIILQLEKELNKHTNGIGLSAPQINIQKNVCIIRTNKIKIDLINPVIIKQYDLMEFYNEACLSFPNESLTTKRFNEIFVQDMLHPSGIICTGFEAVILQHEINHLYGKTMYDFSIKIPTGRNSPCWCKSEKKYKFCHLKKVIYNNLERI